MKDSNDPHPTFPGTGSEKDPEPTGLGSTGQAGSTDGRSESRSSRTGDQDRDPAGQDGRDAEETRHHRGPGHQERVSHPRDIEDIEDHLTRAFQNGDPVQVWELSRRLVTLARESVVAGAKARFRVNFNTSLCNTCEGMRAGPKVQATCFQIRQCYFDNVKDDPTPKQTRVLKLISDSE